MGEFPKEEIEKWEKEKLPVIKDDGRLSLSTILEKDYGFFKMATADTLGDIVLFLKKCSLQTQIDYNTHCAHSTWSMNVVDDISTSISDNYTGYTFQERRAKAALDNDRCKALRARYHIANIKRQKMYNLVERIESLIKTIEAIFISKLQNNRKGKLRELKTN